MKLNQSKCDLCGAICPSDEVYSEHWCGTVLVNGRQNYIPDEIYAEVHIKTKRTKDVFLGIEEEVELCYDCRKKLSEGIWSGSLKPEKGKR